MADPRYTPMDDTVINKELTAIRKEMDIAGRQYALEDPSKIRGLTIATAIKLCHHLRLVMSVESDDVQHVAKVLSFSSATPKQLFVALLSHTVHREILAKPFFFLTGRPELGNGDIPDRAEYSTIFREIYKGEIEGKSQTPL